MPPDGPDSRWNAGGLRLSRRSQHLRRKLQKDREAWNAYMPEAAEEARRIAFGMDPSRRMGEE